MMISKNFYLQTLDVVVNVYTFCTFKILYNQQIRTICTSKFCFFQIRMICTSNVHSFLLNFHDFVLQRNQISQQVQNICTSNVHNFPLNFHNLVRSTIFISIKISRFCMFNNFEIFIKSG